MSYFVTLVNILLQALICYVTRITCICLKHNWENKHLGKLSFIITLLPQIIPLGSKSFSVL